MLAFIRIKRICRKIESESRGDLCQTSFQFQSLVSVITTRLMLYTIWIVQPLYNIYIVALLRYVFWTWVWYRSYLTSHVDQFNFICETLLTKSTVRENLSLEKYLKYINYLTIAILFFFFWFIVKWFSSIRFNLRRKIRFVYFLKRASFRNHKNSPR